MFSHIDKQGQPRMVDISDKEVSWRTARARCVVRLPAPVQEAFAGGDYISAKGPVMQTAIIAGVMAAKRTHEWIPFCHPLGLERCRVDIEPDTEGHLVVTSETGVHHKTGVEMEALVAAQAAALTIYDMCKALSHDMVIDDLRLLAKSGGKADFTHEGGKGTDAS